MYFSTGFSQNLMNISVLAKSADPKLLPTTVSELKSGYYKYIEQYQPYALVKDFRPNSMTRVSNAGGLAQLARVYKIVSNLNDLNQESLIDLSKGHTLEGVDENIQAALGLIQKYDPNLYSMTNLVFNYYFLAHSKRAGGGSSSGGLGVLWLNPQASWKVQDYAEMLIHELTHQLLFIDERCFGHYCRYDLMADAKYFAYSSILNKTRPLDKVVHSLFVALNVLAFRRNVFGLDSKPILHPGSEKMIQSLELTFDSLSPFKGSMFTERLNELLGLAESATQNIRGAL